MKIITLLTILAALIMIGIRQEAKAGTILLPKYGFQIDPLDAQVQNTPAEAIAMFLPPKHSFTANVNVQVQPYGESIKDYITLSDGQFKQAGLQVISEKQNGDNEWICEYSGDFRGRTLHWYARAILRGNKIYLITATALNQDWDADSVSLKKCVDSFKLK